MAIDVLSPGRASLSYSFNGLQFLPALLLIAAVLFNPVLAIVNGNLFPLTQTAVISVELLLVVSAHIVAATNYKPEMTPWYVIIGCMAFFACFRSAALGELDLKSFRDVLLIPTFVVVGMTANRASLVTAILTIHAVVLVFLFLEAVNTEAFSSVFKVLEYYVNTRGFGAEDFWNSDSDLFVSASRPDERFFNIGSIHRLSSIFLEPVSLGNYCTIIAAFVCSTYKRLSGWTRAFLIVGTLVLLVGSDGRLATASIGIVIAVTVFAPYLPRYTAALYLPAATIAAFLLVDFAGFRTGTDDFPGRVAFTVALLRDYGLSNFLGTAPLDPTAADSGISYMIATQSVFGLAFLWAFMAFASVEKTVEQVRYTHALFVYLSMTMMVSASFLTIKTAALLWFIHGSIQIVQPVAFPASRQSKPSEIVQ